MDHEIKMMLNAILEEIGQIDERTNKRFDKIESKLDSLQHEVEYAQLKSSIFSPPRYTGYRVVEAGRRVSDSSIAAAAVGGRQANVRMAAADSNHR